MKHRTWLGLQAEFWHAHFNYAALRTDPALAAFFFCCIAEQAIKPYKATNTPNPKHNTKQKEHGKCLEGETRGEKRVKRPKRPRPCGHGSMDSLAGDQICQWNSVTSDFILPATRLSVFVPPPLGAFLSWLTIRTTRTSNPLQHPLPTPLLSSLYNKTFSFLCRRSLVTKTNFSLSLDCLHQKVTSVRRLSHFLVIPTSK